MKTIRLTIGTHLSNITLKWAKDTKLKVVGIEGDFFLLEDGKKVGFDGVFEIADTQVTSNTNIEVRNFRGRAEKIELASNCFRRWFNSPDTTISYEGVCHH